MKKIALNLVIVALAFGVFSTAHAGFKVSSAITRQSVANDKTATIELVTVVARPYKMTRPAFKVRMGFRVTKTQEVGSMICRGKACKQRFYMTMVPTGSRVCRLDGDYKLVLTVTCTAKKGCTHKPTKPYAISFRLRSENFCSNKTVTKKKP